MTSLPTSLVIGFALSLTSFKCRSEEHPVSSPSQRALVLREALRGADRIELTPNHPGAPEKEAVTITGAAVFESALKERGAGLGAAQLFFEGKYFRDLSPVAREFLAPRLLRAVIQTDQTDNAFRAIVTLDEIASVAVNEVLRDLAAGNIKPASPEQSTDENPGLKYAAALALARRGDPAARKMVNTLNDTIKPCDQAALAIARCYLGEHSAVRAEHFKVYSLHLSRALVAALERQGDKEALNLLITKGFDLHWAIVIDEAVLAVQRMTGKTWCPPGSDTHESNYCPDIRVWWQAANASWQPPSQQPADGKTSETPPPPH